jgi:hypothetical protein
MLSGTLFTIRNRALATILTTIGWLVLMSCWLAFAWSRYSLFQHLVGLGISTLLFAAIVGAVWVLEQGWIPTATILATLGWLSFALYWIGFVWSRHTLLQNGAVLIVSFFVYASAILALWYRGRADACC